MGHHIILTHADFKNKNMLSQKTWKLRQHVMKTCSFGAKNVVNFTTETNQQRFIGPNWQVEMWNYAQNLSRFKDGSNPMMSFDPKIFKAAVRSSLDKIWRRCFEEPIVEVCYRGLNLQMHTWFAVAHTKITGSVFKMGWSANSKKRKFSRNLKTMDLIIAMTNGNVRSVRVKSIRVWTDEYVSSLRVAKIV